MPMKIIQITQPAYTNYIQYNNYHDEFIQVVKNFKVKVMYQWLHEDGNTRLGFLYSGLFHVFDIPDQFTSMELRDRAIKEGFPTCTFDQWTKLKELGYTNEDQMHQDRGDYGVDQWIEIKTRGYGSCEEFDQEKGTGIVEDIQPVKLDVDTFQFNIAVIDGTNIAWGDYEDYPKYKFLQSTYKKLIDLGVKPYIVVSAALRHKIDQPIELVEFLKQDDVCEAPAQRADDFFVIQLAFAKDAFIVSNDRFKDWKKANPDLADEIENRRVALTFTDDDPHFDHKLYKLIKRPAKFT